MKYPAVHAAFYNTPHAITAEKLAEIEGFLAGKFHPPMVMELPQPLTSEEKAKLVAEFERMHTGVQGKMIVLPVEARETYTAGPRDSVQMVGRVAVVPVFGVLAQRMGMMQAMSGGTSTEAIGAALDNLGADRGVKTVVMNFETPGGSVFGIPELAEKMLKLRSEKKLVGVANSNAHSAGYWLLSQCEDIVVTPSGQLGCIGVIAAHTDESKAEEQAGVKTTYITAGEYKGEGFKPLTDESQAAIQKQVDAYYDMFTKAVAKGRGTTDGRVRTDFGKGRPVMAKDAVTLGMADRIATFEQTVRRLAGDEAAASSARASRERTAQMAAMGIPI